MIQRVGSIRPSQLMWSYGVGAMIDLPRLSVMVEGLDRWNTNDARIITEERLLAAVRRELGPQVQRLHEPPMPEREPFGQEADAAALRIGVPVGLFPGYLRCPRCGLLGEPARGFFEIKGNERYPDSLRYEHTGCEPRRRQTGQRRRRSNPAVVPARFLVACEAGHIDDFPWREYVHRGPTTCTAPLRFFEVGSSLETANLFVACDNGLDFGNRDEDTPEHPGGGDDGCGARPRSMVDAFGRAATESLPSCRGRHPHLRYASGLCGRQLHTMLLGSSSSWFPKAISALSIPTGGSELGQLIEDRWSQFGEVQNVEEIAFLRRLNQLGSATSYSDEEIWDAIDRYRNAEPTHVDTEDMKAPEWDVFSHPDSAPQSVDFELEEGHIPDGHAGHLAATVLAHRLREVNALVGFTRLEAPEDLVRGDTDLTYAPLANSDPNWVPATEVRGEGILVRFDPEQIGTWEERSEVRQHLASLQEANMLWRQARRLRTDIGYPGHRHVLIHTFSHLLMRELALECGYSSSSIRERIYASGGMAGVLIYTAAPDSEGTLGGLVRLGEARMLGSLVSQAIDHARLCAADPLCSEHDPVPDRTLHAAACHACTFAPETACEFGNRFLDRSTVVGTLGAGGVSYFG